LQVQSEGVTGPTVGADDQVRWNDLASVEIAIVDLAIGDDDGPHLSSLCQQAKTRPPNPDKVGGLVKIKLLPSAGIIQVRFKGSRHLANG
jgi:hypothetical protein